MQLKIRDSNTEWLTEKASEVEKLLTVFGKATRKLFLTKWVGHPGEDSWMPEHLLLKEGCKDSIDDFWLKSGLSPTQDFYPDVEGANRCWMCGYKR